MKREKGSALFIILIAVVLFAALAYSVAQMMQGGSPDAITTEKGRLYADEILNYSRAMRQAAQNMKISNGCSDSDISFETAQLTGYEHTPSANDPCKLFNNSGGGVVYQEPVAEWLDTAMPAPTLRGEWFFPGDVCVTGTGTAQTNCSADADDNEALIAVLPYIKKQLCIEINNRLGVVNPGGTPPQETSNAWTTMATKFTGEQSDGEKLEQSGRMAGCFEGAAASTPLAKTYHFYQVLIPR